jgi:hypothetical protein
MERKSNYGGARAGAGRPKGSTNKITAQDLLDAAHKVNGKPFVVNLMEGYQQSIDERNNKVRVMYEKMILDKVIADRQHIEVVESEETLQAKRQAFAEALANLTTIGKRDE